jgi:hypothetical protein
MHNANRKSDVIAVGPVFSSKGARRVVLLKQRNEEGDTKEYAIINRPTARERAAGSPGNRMRKTNSFTHAVRLFCDSLLEQAWRDYWKHEKEAGL